MNKIELLAPAGNLEKLKIAYLYGADAVYIGGKSFSLRARANNFTLDDIREASIFAHNLNKKLYITMNIVPHDSDLLDLIEYLKFLEECHIDGIIVSSMYIATMAKKYAPKLELHLSTQASVSNSLAIKEYEKRGFCRVVLAREVTLEKIKMIREKTDMELEVFIHGGMCSSYSGRCMLSNHLTSRDANRGGCAHSCRWNYDAFDNDKKVNKNGLLNIGSRDLNGLLYITKLIDLGCSSLKIEGRMKSLYYIAVIVRCYRQLIDEYNNNKIINNNNKIINNYDYYTNEILKAENRLTGCGFLNGMVTKNEQLYNVKEENPTKDFLGIVLEYDLINEKVVIEQRNYFACGDVVEFFGPNLKNTQYVLPNIFDEKGDLLDAARHPLQKISFSVPFVLSKYDMMRKL